MKKIVALTVAALGVMSFTVFAQDTTVTRISTADPVGVETVDNNRENCVQSGCDTFNACGQGEECENAPQGQGNGQGCCN